MFGMFRREPGVNDAQVFGSEETLALAAEGSFEDQGVVDARLQE